MACQQMSFGPRFHPRTAPVTFWLVVISAAVTLGFFVTSLSASVEQQLGQLLIFVPNVAGQRPWTMLTYPFVNVIGPFWFLLLGYMLWWAGADLERWWGSRVQAGFLAVVSIASALMLCLSVLLLPNLPFKPLAGAEPLLAAIFTVWGLRNSGARVLLIFVPVTGAIIAALAVASVWFSYGPYHGFFVMLGSAGLGALYYYQGHRFHALLRRLHPSPVKRQARERDKRFRKIMEKSGLHLVEDERERKP